MAMTILASECTNCCLCVDNCPMKAILQAEPVERGAVPTILSERCTECVGHFTWPRCAALCPADAVRRDPDHLESHSALLTKWFTLTGRDVYEHVEPPALEPPVEIGEASD